TAFNSDSSLGPSRSSWLESIRRMEHGDVSPHRWEGTADESLYVCHDLIRLLRWPGRRSHELRTRRVADRLPHNFIDGFQRGQIQLPATDIGDRPQLVGMTCSPKGNGDEWLV